MLDLSPLNPRRKYPRRYNPGHFLKLAVRFCRRKNKRQSAPARFLFDTIFGSDSIRKSLKAISGHGLFPIVIATAVTITGHSYILIRSIALLLCALWVSLDVGVVLSEKKWALEWKSIAFLIGWCGSFCAALGIMSWFIESTLEDQLVDVYRNLSVTAYSSSSDNPFMSMFTATNSGGTAIGRHRISCWFILATSADGATAEGGPFTFKGDTMILNSANPDVAMSESPILPGGDAQTDHCLSAVGLATVTCADVVVEVAYSLVTQPEVKQSKQFRFVAYPNSEIGQPFIWHRQPVGQRGSYCKSFVRRH